MTAQDRQYSQHCSRWTRVIQAAKAIGFGYIEGIVIESSGQYSYENAVKLYISGKNNRIPASNQCESGLHSKWIEFFQFIFDSQASQIRRLDIANGLPVKAEVVADVHSGQQRP